MAEDRCLIQYVRDNFCDEFTHNNNYVNIADHVDGDDTYCLDFNTFTESSTLADHDASPVTTLASDLFGSPSPSTEAPPSAMESTPYMPATGCYSPPGEPGLQVPSVLNNLNLRSFGSSTLDRPLLNKKEYPMLASYGLAQAFGPNSQPEHALEDYGRQAQDFEGITLDEVQFVTTNCTPTKSTPGVNCNGEGERPSSSFWRGKSPALLMQQLKGPSLSASSSSSEARSNIKSPSSNQPFQQFSPSAAQSPTQNLAPRTPLHLTSLILSNRTNYRTSADVDIKSSTFGSSPVLLEPIVPTVSKSSAPPFGRQRSLPPLGDVNIDMKMKTILSPGRSQGQGVQNLQSSGSFPGSFKLGDVEMQATTSLQSNIKQRRCKIMPGLAIVGEMQQRNIAAASGNNNNNNSWSSGSTSPGPSSNNIDHGKELAANFDLITSSMQKYNSKYSSVSPVVTLDRDMLGDRVWKKAKGELGSTSSVSEDAVQAAILATAMVEQKEKNQLREKFLALLQMDSSTSKDYKAQILDDTIRYLKDLRWRLNFHEADSTTPESNRFPESGFQADEFSNEASPTTSSRCRQLHGEGLASPVRLKDLELETAGVEISPHLTVDSGPHIEVRMMENQHVMVKLAAKDRPGLFHDIAVVLRSLRLDIQHANVRTGNNGQRHDIFAAKMQLPCISSQSTHAIAMALNQVISASATPLASPEPHTPQI